MCKVNIFYTSKLLDFNFFKRFLTFLKMKKKFIVFH